MRMRILHTTGFVLFLLTAGCSQFDRNNPADPGGTSFLEVNSLPNEPHTPLPYGGEAGVPTDNLLMSWECDDPDRDPLEYRLYLGRDNPPPLHSIHWLSAAERSIPGPLEPASAYFWQVEVRDDHGNIRLGPAWRFTTNAHPDMPTNPSPGHLDRDVLVSLVVLRWGCTDPDSDRLEYQVYFGTTDEPPPATDHWITGTNFTLVDALQPETLYFWRVEARDEHGLIRVGPLWEFTTRRSIAQ